MNPSNSPAFLFATVGISCIISVLTTQAQNSPSITNIEFTTPGEVRITGNVESGRDYRLQFSRDLQTWSSLVTATAGIGEITHMDRTAGDQARYYRIAQLAEAAALTGDHLQTDDGDVIFHPVDHASFVMRWNDTVVFADPVGVSRLYRGFQTPAVVLVSHAHGDHFDANLLSSVTDESTTILAPQIVWNGMSQTLRDRTQVIANGETKTAAGVEVEAVPAYNITAGRLNYHPPGVGNSYVVTMGNRRIFISGDTEAVPEMRALENIDVAFLCMNLPFTMTPDQAASAAIDFQPKIVYPYHYSNSDINRFKQLVEEATTVEVRLREWY